MSSIIIRYIITIFEQMGAKDRVLWSAEKALKKIRDRSGSKGAVQTDVVYDHSLEQIAPSDGSDIDVGTVDMTSIEEVIEPTPVEVPGPVTTPIPLIKRANHFKRSISASSREIDIRPSPLGLSFVGLVALVFASLYLMRLLSSLDAIQDDMSIFKRVFSGGLLLFLFYQYIGYVITIFQLKSGLRGSWAAMMRSSGSYVILMILANTHLFDWLPFDLVAFPSWALLLCMTAILIYMLLPDVRDYYRPPYEDKVPLTAWLAFIFWIDPYGSIEDELDVAINMDTGL